MRCFFHIAGAIRDVDDAGVEIATIGEARLMAARYLSEVLKDQPDSIWLGDEVRVEVTDIDNLVLFTVISFGVDAPATAAQPRSFRPPDVEPGT